MGFPHSGLTPASCRPLSGAPCRHRPVTQSVSGEPDTRQKVLFGRGLIWLLTTATPHPPERPGRYSQARLVFLCRRRPAKWLRDRGRQRLQGLVALAHLPGLFLMLAAVTVPLVIFSFGIRLPPVGSAKTRSGNATVIVASSKTLFRQLYDSVNAELRSYAEPVLRQAARP